MFSEMVKLVPSVDPGALKRMFQTLNQRFAQVAKKFGEGLKNAFKFTGAIAIIGGLFSKLLNPLEKAEEIINRIIDKGDDAMTNAEEFGADPGKLLRLEALGRAKGLDADTLRTLLGKFQSELAKEQEAAKSGGKPGLLREFVGEKDTAQAFFDFLQSMQRLDKSRQTVVQGEIFGEKIRGKASEFFNADDFAAILAKLPSAEVLAEAAQKSGKVADERDLLAAIRESQDFVNKSGRVDESMVKAIDVGERKKLQGEDETLARFDSLKQTNIAVQELTHKVDTLFTDFIQNAVPKLLEGMTLLSQGITILTPIITTAGTMLETGFNRGIEATAKVVTAIEQAWGEFKGSRIYKYFGGN